MPSGVLVARIALLASILLQAILFSIGSLDPWVGLATPSMFLVFLFAGLGVLPTVLVHDRTQQSSSALTTLVGALGVGMALSTVLFGLSLYMIKSVSLGGLAILVLSAFGVITRGRSFTQLVASLVASPSALWTTALSLLMGCHIFGLNEFQIRETVFFSGRWDLQIHTYWAVLVHELGLPLVNDFGIPTAGYVQTHTGLSAILSGTRWIARITPYEASRTVGVLWFMLVGQSALLVIVSRAKLSEWTATLFALSTLTWGSLSLLVDLLNWNLPGVLDPYMMSTLRPAAPSGSLYHNLTELGSVALCLAGLAVLASNRKKQPVLVVLSSLALMGVAANIKPSILVAFFPAVVLTFCLARNLRLTIAAVAVFAVAIAYLFLPKLLWGAASGHVSWVMSWGKLFSLEVLFSSLIVLGVFVLPLLEWPRRLWAQMRARTWETLTIVLFAVVGGLVFSAIFNDVARPHHGNQNWPLLASLVIAVPFVLSVVFDQKRRDDERGRFLTSRVRSIFVTSIFAIQLIGGAIYFFGYPHISLARVPKQAIEQVVRLTDFIPIGTRLLVDPSLLRHRELLPYLGRQTIHWGGYDPSKESEHATWKLISSGRGGDWTLDFLSGRDAMVVGPSTSHLEPLLRNNGWRPAEQSIDGSLRIWWNPLTAIGARR